MSSEKFCASGSQLDHPYSTATKASPSRGRSGFLQRLASRFGLLAGLCASLVLLTPSAATAAEDCLGIAIDKQVSIDGGQTWYGADNHDVAPTMVIGGDSEYRFVVNNCSENGRDMTDFVISDETLGISPTPVEGMLSPGDQFVLTSDSLTYIAADGATTEQASIGFEDLIQPGQCYTSNFTRMDVWVIATDQSPGVAVPRFDSAHVNCENPPPAIEICTLVTLNPDQASDMSDADAISGDGCDVFDQVVPVGVIDSVDGTYRLKLTNTGPETLVNVRINAPDFGLVDEPVPAACGDLDPGEMCVINFDDPNAAYNALSVPDICDAQGPPSVTRLASVNGEGAGSGIAVSDDDPATVACVSDPQIALRKEVSLDGVQFHDANTPGSAPSGLLGANAEYRLTVTNTGTETLVNAVVSDATLGLVNVPVPGGPLAPNDVRVITQSDFGYAGLFVTNRCDNVGDHLNTADVSAVGQFSGMAVDAIDPAYVACENPQIELRKQVSINGVDFFDADQAGDSDVPVGIVGQTNASYRLLLTNIGSESLTNVVVEDASLGINQSVFDLLPGESRVIDSGDIGFGNLYQADRCDGSTGNKANIASVVANGVETGTEVSDDDPANLRCIVGPAIELVKQVSLSGGEPFFDANTEATAVAGLVGDDATYRLIVRNIGDEDLTNVSVDDSTLGIVGAVVGDLPFGAVVVLDAGSFHAGLQVANRCDAAGYKLNLAQVSANGAITGVSVQDEDPAVIDCALPLICDVRIDATCEVAQTSTDLLCTDAIAATTLLYTGPDLAGATVVFEGDKSGYAEYVGVDLISNVTLLTMAGQNDFSIDATVSGDQLGSKTRITINGVTEIIHTSCSAIYAAGQPAPLDGNTPVPPNSEKGDPSPNWWVVNFRQKDEVFIEQPGVGNAGSDSCTVPYGGAQVNYSYAISNLGSTEVDLLSVLDNQLGERLPAIPTLLGVGETLVLGAGPVFIDSDTTSSVNVAAQVSGEAAASCPTDDIVVVSVEPPPPLPCSDIKPITALSMVWNGVSGVDVTTEGGQLFSNVQNGNLITFDAADLGNDVELFISGATSGASKFHVSCSDSAMNGPEDCGSSQGNGKGDDAGLVNDWALEAMIGGTGAFTCNLPNTGVVQPQAGGGGGGGADIVSTEFKEIKDEDYKFYINNNGSTNVTIVRMTISWPVSVNGDLKEIKRGSSKIYDTDTSVSPVTVTGWIDKEDKRRIKAGESKEFKLRFEDDADTNLSAYSIEIELNTGTVLSLP